MSRVSWGANEINLISWEHERNVSAPPQCCFNYTHASSSSSSSTTRTWPALRIRRVQRVETPLKLLNNECTLSKRKCSLFYNFLFFSLSFTATNIRYQITGGNIGNAFAVQNTTGVIYVASPLDYETRPKVSRLSHLSLSLSACLFARLRVAHRRYSRLKP